MRKIILIIAATLTLVGSIIAIKPDGANACAPQKASCNADQPQIWQPPLPTLAPIPSWGEKPNSPKEKIAATPGPETEKKYPPMKEVLTCKKAAQIMVEIRLPHKDKYGSWIFPQIQKLNTAQKRALAKLLSKQCGCNWTFGSTLVCPKELEIFDN